jgi:hypothetical protein
MVNITDPGNPLGFHDSDFRGAWELVCSLPWRFIRRWQQIRYARYVHTLQRRYRPVLAKVLSGRMERRRN